MSKRTLTDFFGSATNKKAKQSSSPRHKPVFIVCPGAGGVLPKDGNLEKQLGRLGRVVVIPKSTGYNGKIGCTQPGKGSSLNLNLSILSKQIRKEMDHASSEQNAPIVLVGQSFGCRLIVHWMSANHEVRKHPSIPVPWSSDATPDNYADMKQRIAAVLFFGYPLSHPTQDRSAALQRLPSNVRALFIMGTSDKQSLGDGLSQPAFEGVLKKTAATTEIVWIHRGNHAPPKPDQWGSTNLHAKIKTFVASSFVGVAALGNSGTASVVPAQHT